MSDKQKTHSHFDQYIQHKALSFKFDDSGNVLDVMLDKSDDGQIGGIKFKNVCAKLTEQLVDEMDGICGMLQMSKRQFIELAVIEALERCNSIFEEVDVFEYENARENARKAKKEGV